MHWLCSVLLRGVFVGVGLGVAATGAWAQAEPASSPPAAAVPAVPEANPAIGRKLFQRNCALCHGVSGEGGMGPALSGISSRLTTHDIAEQIKNPKGVMPRFYPAPIDDTMLAHLLSYIVKLR